MKKNVSDKNFKTVSLIILTLLFIIGIVLATTTMLNSQKRFQNEQDNHLLDLAATVDYVTNNSLQHCRLDLDSMANSFSYSSAEDAFIKSHDSKPLQTAISESLAKMPDYVDSIIVSYNDKIILSNDTSCKLLYQIREDADEDDLVYALNNNTGEEFLAIFKNSEKNDFTYFLLIDMLCFYNTIVANRVYDNYWIVLYDPGCGLVMRNDRDTPSPLCYFYTKEELASRNDGLTLIYNQEKKGEAASESYSYTEPSGTVLKNRISIIPTKSTINGNFSVAVTAYDSDLMGESSIHLLNFFIAALLIAFSLALAFFIILNFRRKQSKLEDELEALEKQNELAKELLQRQENLSHHQKLETIGTLTAGIAHEFNNLLSPIMGESLLILENTPDTEETYDNALEIYQASTKAKEIVAKISKLSAKNSGINMKPIGPAALIDNALSVAASGIPANINVEKKIYTNCRLLGLEAELMHMLLNLILNAVYSMTPDGGTLTVSSWDESENLFISVSDTGKGIAEDNLEKIFEPFFTTKEYGQGTGLGLAIVHRTVENHSGDITAENLPGKGAKFTVSFPIYTE